MPALPAWYSSSADMLHPVDGSHASSGIPAADAAGSISLNAFRLQQLCLRYPAVLTGRLQLPAARIIRHKSSASGRWAATVKDASPKSSSTVEYAQFYAICRSSTNQQSATHTALLRHTPPSILFGGLPISALPFRCLSGHLPAPECARTVAVVTRGLPVSVAARFTDRTSTTGTFAA